MNSLAFSFASQIGFSRKHFFVVNGLAFPLSNLILKLSGHDQEQFYLATLAGTSVLDSSTAEAGTQANQYPLSRLAGRAWSSCAKRNRRALCQLGQTGERRPPKLMLLTGPLG